MNIQISNKIGEIINTSNCISYVITGYQYLETRLVLNFEDYKQVFDFKEKGTGKDAVIIVETFYTKDHSEDEKLDERKFFRNIHKKEQPEDDLVIHMKPLGEEIL